MKAHVEEHAQVSRRATHDGRHPRIGISVSMQIYSAISFVQTYTLVDRVAATQIRIRLECVAEEGRSVKGINE